MTGSPAARTLLGMLVLTTLPAVARPQFRAPPATPAYAIENATVVHADGRRDVGVTVVVRGRLIVAMGAEVPVPPDATVLDGDSLLVYPGLVDAHGTAEVALPENEPADSVRSWNGPRNLEGFLAHRRVVDHLSASGEVGNTQRGRGVVAAGIHPDGALAAGLGAVIVYRAGVERPWDLVANERLGLAMAFKSGTRVYPGTLFGVIAYMRQAFEDARRDGLIRAAYDADPQGLPAPSVDPDYAVLREVMAGQLPVYFAVQEAEDIRRVLGLADEYGFRPVIVGGHEAWRLADELARRDVPVLIDGDFPEPDKWKPESSDDDDPEDDDESPAEDDEAEHDMPAASPDDDTDDLEPAAAREKQRIEAIRANAARLAQAGVRFAITSGGGKGDLRDAARLSMEYGLSEATALRAVTSTPASLLGLPHLTRIEPGLAATFLATNGTLFDEDAEIVHVFVEGTYQEGAAAGGSGEAPAAVVTGDWTLNLTSGDDGVEVEASLDMEPDGKFTGTVTGEEIGSAPIRGRVSGTTMRFTITLAFGGESFELTGEAEVTGDQMTGSGDGPFGSFTLSGRKNPGGGR